jgi:hypothetical protein
MRRVGRAQRELPQMRRTADPSGCTGTRAGYPCHHCTVNLAAVSRKFPARRVMDAAHNTCGTCTRSWTFAAHQADTHDAHETNVIACARCPRTVVTEALFALFLRQCAHSVPVKCLQDTKTIVPKLVHRPPHAANLRARAPTSSRLCIKFSNRLSAAACAAAAARTRRKHERRHRWRYRVRTGLVSVVMRLVADVVRAWRRGSCS